MSSKNKEGIEPDNSSGIKISKWIYVVIIVMGGILAYYLLAPGTDKVVEKCINNYANVLARENTNEKVTSEVISYDNLVILTPPNNPGYYILDFNVILLIKQNLGINSKKQNIPIKEFKCFYDRTKYNEWQLRNNT